MKNKSIFRFFVNLVLYTAIALALYFLYAPANTHPGNKTSSSVQFIYQQF